jgi:hypothetical protein
MMNARMSPMKKIKKMHRQQTPQQELHAFEGSSGGWIVH